MRAVGQPILRHTARLVGGAPNDSSTISSLNLRRAHACSRVRITGFGVLVRAARAKWRRCSRYNRLRNLPATGFCRGTKPAAQEVAPRLSCYWRSVGRIASHNAALPPFGTGRGALGRGPAPRSTPLPPTLPWPVTGPAEAHGVPWLLPCCGSLMWDPPTCCCGIVRPLDTAFDMVSPRIACD